MPNLDLVNDMKQQLQKTEIWNFSLSWIAYILAFESLQKSFKKIMKSPFNCKNVKMLNGSETSNSLFLQIFNVNILENIKNAIEIGQYWENLLSAFEQYF